jgi:cell division protein FtsW (lipid II flippase)
MKQSINWKKLITWFVILLPILLLIDVGFDATKGPIKWDEIWAMKNMFFKVAAALVGAYFISTFNSEPKKDDSR